MRICMLVYNPLTRDTRVFRQAATLAAQGDSVDVIGWRPAELPEIEERDGFTLRRIRRDPIHWRARRRIRGLKARLMRPLGRDPGPIGAPRRRKGFVHRQLMLLDWLRRAHRLTAERPPADVYVAHDLNTLPAAVSAARRANARLVYDSHELFTERELLSPVEKLLWRVVERRLIGRANRVITVSESIAGELVRRYRIERPAVIQNCPELVDAVPDDAAQKLRNAASLPLDEPIVLYQGMIQPERGLEHLVEAAGEIDRGCVVLVGSGRLEAALRTRVEDSGLGERVRLIGEVPPDELPTYTAGATIGVAPIEGRSLSYRYAAPNKLFEYLAAGLPVVATRLPEMERVVREHEVGLLCEPGDTAGLAAAINRLLADRELYERCHNNALAAARVFNWQNESKKLLALYRTLGAGAR